jgi:transposase
LEDARAYFGISKSRDQQKNSNAANIKAAKMRGLTQRKVAEELGLGLRTVKRYWK